MLCCLGCFTALLVVAAPGLSADTRAPSCGHREGRRIILANRDASVFFNASDTLYGCFKPTGRLTQLAAGYDLLAQGLSGRFAAIASVSVLGLAPDAAGVPTLQVFDLRRARLLRYVHSAVEEVFVSPRGAAAWIGGTSSQYLLSLLDRQGVHVLVAGAAPISSIAFVGDRLRWRSAGRDHAVAVHA